MLNVGEVEKGLVQQEAAIEEAKRSDHPGKAGQLETESRQADLLDVFGSAEVHVRQQLTQISPLLSTG